MSVNLALFQIVNAGPGAHPATIFAAEAAATGLVPVATLIGLLLWIRGDHRRRGILLAAALATALALLLNQVAGMLWFEPRPFMIGVGRTLLSHAPDNSFPSDHVSFLLSMGFVMLATEAMRRWGLLVLGLGALTAWARVYLGVHFPIDILGSAVIAAAASITALSLQPLLVKRPLGLIEHLYRGTLDILRLPPRLFPRDSARPD